MLRSGGPLWPTSLLMTHNAWNKTYDGGGCLPSVGCLLTLGQHQWLEPRLQPFVSWCHRWPFLYLRVLFSFVFYFLKMNLSANWLSKLLIAHKWQQLMTIMMGEASEVNGSKKELSPTYNFFHTWHPPTWKIGAHMFVWDPISHSCLCFPNIHHWKLFFICCMVYLLYSSYFEPI